MPRPPLFSLAALLKQAHFSHSKGENVEFELPVKSGSSRKRIRAALLESGLPASAFHLTDRDSKLFLVIHNGNFTKNALDMSPYEPPVPRSSEASPYYVSNERLLSEEQLTAYLKKPEAVNGLLTFLSFNPQTRESHEHFQEASGRWVFLPTS